MASVEISGYESLLALHKTIAAAKFARHPETPEVQGSPHVAEVANRTLDALIEEVRSTRGEAEAKKWENWRQVRIGEVPWNIALSRLNESKVWHNWSKSELNKVVRDLLAPFVASSEVIEALIDEAESNSAEDRGGPS